MEKSIPYLEFRNQLDKILQNKNPEAVRRFLVEQGQWPEGTSTDVEHAMWIMIAGSPALQSLHAEAQTWLIQHGYRAEAEMLGERDKPPRKIPSPKAGAKARRPPSLPARRAYSSQASARDR